ncbi:hypothetical protein [Flavobacterium sp.]|uniref:hypothetical protein n=1 Tax=Flavobacterium sp. TaxID=239 RepID=UPI002FD92412
MKKLFLRPTLMLFAFGLAIFSAFAFKPVLEESALTIYDGHLQVSPGNCVNQFVECQSTDNGKPCYFGSVQLRRMNISGTSCPTLLWEIDQ